MVHFKSGQWTYWFIQRHRTTNKSNCSADIFRDMVMYIEVRICNEITAIFQLPNNLFLPFFQVLFGCCFVSSVNIVKLRGGNFKGVCFIVIYWLLKELFWISPDFKNSPANLSYFPILKTSSRRLQCKNFSFSTTSWRCAYKEESVFKKTSCKHGRQKNVILKMSWRRLDDFLNTSSTRLHQDECLLGGFFSKALLHCYPERYSGLLQTSRKSVL